MRPAETGLESFLMNFPCPGHLPLPRALRARLEPRGAGQGRAGAPPYQCPLLLSLTFLTSKFWNVPSTVSSDCQLVLFCFVLFPI